MERILIVEDDLSTLRMLAASVEQAGYRVVAEQTAAAALAQARREHPDLIVLDLLLPDENGLEVCRSLRALDETRSIPILMVTSLDKPSDKVSGLDQGADDYMVKPVDVTELLARIRALLRRRLWEPESGNGGAAITLDGFVIQPDRLAVTRDGSGAVQLTALEFKLLYQLASRPDETFSRAALQALVWGNGQGNTERAVDVLVNRLRSKLGELPGGTGIVRTVRGVGYRFRG
jgi:DNA-binding response OmpR family regulator